jgi:diadenosine tetraphosphatase ApaH/serine/threonine PP2A family protein phosphatase
LVSVRVAVLSDIHANRPALDAVLAALPEVDALWQLGDIVGYGPHPVAVIETLETRSAGGVRGNHDAAAIGAIDTDWFNGDARVAVEWSGMQLTPATRAWLTALPATHVAGDFTLAHGSPRDPVWEYVDSPSIAAGVFDSFETTHCLVGHTHVPLVFRQVHGGVEAIDPQEGEELHLDERRTILNPGSVGQPRDGDPRASAMILDTTALTATWLRVPYPIGETQAAMRSVGLPLRLVERLSYGL